MVANEDHQYVLAMLLPLNMPWNWFERVFSREDSTDLWYFMGDATGLLQQDEYVTAYPTKANSHPLMKHQKGFDAKPPDTFPYHPSACVKLILRNVRSLRNDMPPVIFRKSLTPDKFWCAVRMTWLAGLSARRNSMMRSHPDALDGVFCSRAAVVIRGDQLGQSPAGSWSFREVAAMDELDLHAEVVDVALGVAARGGAEEHAVEPGKATTKSSRSRGHPD